MTIARSAYVKISVGAISQTITITQDGSSAIISLDKTEQNVSSSAGNFNVGLTSNGTWDVTNKPDWITLTPSFGNSNASVNVSYLQNTGVNERMTTMLFSNGAASTTLSIIQLGSAPAIEIDPSTVQEIAASGGTVPVTITSNTAWAVISNQPWASISTTSGDGNGNSMITVSANNTTTADVAMISFAATGVDDVTLTINRAGASPEMNLDATSKNVTASAGTFNVAAIANGEWTTSEIPSWITLTPISGNDNTSVNIYYQANTNVAERNATITFTNGTATKTLSITQAGAATMLSIFPNTTQNIVSSGGSIPITITSNAVWAISSNQTWISVGTASGSGNGSTTITVAKNTTGSSRKATVTFSAVGMTPITVTINQSFSQFDDLIPNEL